MSRNFCFRFANNEHIFVYKYICEKRERNLYKKRDKRISIIVSLLSPNSKGLGVQGSSGISPKSGFCANLNARPNCVSLGLRAICIMYDWSEYIIVYRAGPGEGWTNIVFRKTPNKFRPFQFHIH